MENIISEINNGNVVVLPTDTLYGLHASVFNEKAVEKIYSLKQRTKSKPLIILISSWEDLEKLNIQVSVSIKKRLKEWWPGSLSVILPCNDEKFKYLHRGSNSLAVRWPDYVLLNNIIKQTGPLVSTTVNLEGSVPAKNIAEAKKLFGKDVAAYLDDGELVGTHSTLVKVSGDDIEVLREGAVII